VFQAPLVVALLVAVVASALLGFLLEPWSSPRDRGNPASTY